MSDLQRPFWMWVKAWLFVAIGVLSAALLLVDVWSWKRAVLLALAIWAFCRAYYFAFYVIDRWIDPGSRYSGLWDFLKRRILRRRGSK